MNATAKDFIASRIASLMAAPKLWRVTTTYACGKRRTEEMTTEDQAKNCAIGERRKIGRDLIDRATGAVVRVVSVDIEKI
ncbi:MAG: hypothetical protein ACK4U0_17390 [Mesorhizobium sp.]